MSLSASAEEISPPITREIVQFVSSLQYEEFSAQTVELAKHCFLDWLGVTVAGSREPLVGMLVDEAKAQQSSQACTLIGSSHKCAPGWAALINGAASHALDYDDVVSSMGGHPSVPVFPALLAAAELSSVSGRQFISAFVAGFEAECRVGALAAPGHYARGFHATGTIGTFGAAAACAHLNALGPEQWQAAFGLAAAQAAGLKCMFGTMTKPFHAGKASANGFLAARLAKRGFSTNNEALEAEQGFIATQADGLNLKGIQDLENELGISRVMFKYHAACYLTHSTIEAILKLQTKNKIDPGDVKSLVIKVPRVHLGVCNIQEPKSGLEAKFSLRFTASLAFLGQDTSDSGFNDDITKDPVLVSFRDKIHVESVDHLPNNYTSIVEVFLKDGERMESSADLSLKTSFDEMGSQWKKLCSKFFALVEPVLGADTAESIIHVVSNLEQCDDMRQVVAILN